MNNRQKSKGITLIALVVTIVVLLILAGVSINLILGENGLISKTKDSRDKTKDASLTEQIVIEIAGSYGIDGGIDMEQLKENLKNNLNIPAQDIIDNGDGGITINKDGLIIIVNPDGTTTQYQKVEASSADWQLNEEGNTIIAYIGSGFDEDTVVIPNYVDNHKITGLGNGNAPIFASNMNVVQGKKLKIETGIKNINCIAFASCSGFIGDLIIPNSVTSIADSAFNGCSGFTGDLTIPNSVTSLANSAFWACRGFSGTLTIGMKNIPNGFCPSGLSGTQFSKLVLEDTVETIGNNAFDRCSSFTGNLRIPASVKTIGDYAFSSCTGFTGDLIIPNSVTSIGSCCFLRMHRIFRRFDNSK